MWSETFPDHNISPTISVRSHAKMQIGYFKILDDLLRYFEKQNTLNHVTD